MPLENAIYLPEYNNSWALIIGINQYQKCNPLEFARQDAEEVADVLITQFKFPENNVILLKDEMATRENIITHFLEYTNNSSITSDDRIIVFFAGHGHTASGRRGEVGYLVPVDGEPGKPASLIRWDELLRNSDLIPAKHILFVMDACYGGLAITRALAPGSKRFLKNMLQRYVRQVLTAGKADETVADAGGSRPGHSIFTSYFLDALEGAASSEEGILTANGVMAYVYDRVSKDHYSKQTPHYGFLEGDGDLILSDLSAIHSDELPKEEGEDTLISIPVTLMEQPELQNISNEPIDRLKILLSDSKYRIQLYDFLAFQNRKFLQQIGYDAFPVQVAAVSPEIFIERLGKYEEVTEFFSRIIILLGKWANDEQRTTLEKIFVQLADVNHEAAGTIAWIGFRWYPALLLFYVGGIAAISEGNYKNLKTMLTPLARSNRDDGKPQELLITVISELSNARIDALFKTLPGHERHYVPRSEYMFTFLQPMLEDTLSLGSTYERLFDRFEVIMSLVYADLHGEGVWGPLGRFAWKYRSRSESDNPFADLVAEAKREGDEWLLLKAGFFNGSFERFNEVATRYETELLQRLSWF